VSHFYNDGRYTYAYDMGAGGYAYGYFEVADDSTVCIAFVTGFPAATRSWKMPDACPDHRDGDRFPIREERDAGPDPLME
jgi:hypothetical protein